MGKKVYVECPVNWAKLREEDRDMGKNMQEGSDARNKIDEVQGRYTVQLMLDKDTKKKMVSDGVPNKGMQANCSKKIKMVLNTSQHDEDTLILSSRIRTQGKWA